MTAGAWGRSSSTSCPSPRPPMSASRSSAPRRLPTRAPAARGAPSWARGCPTRARSPVPDPERFGHINADDVPGGCQFIFTVGLTGCNIVAVRKKTGLHLYHEPTRTRGAASRPTMARSSVVGPKYGDKVFGGYGCGWTVRAVVVRCWRGWNIHVQSHQGCWSPTGVVRRPAGRMVRPRRPPGALTTSPSWRLPPRAPRMPLMTTDLDPFVPSAARARSKPTGLRPPASPPSTSARRLASRPRRTRSFAGWRRFLRDPRFAL